MLNEDCKEILQSLSGTIPLKKNIIKNKQSTGREKDKLDVEYLKKNKGVT